MEYKNLLINIFKKKDLVALKKYDEISKRLSNKDSKFLIKNNLDIIKQHGGDIVKVTKEKNGNFQNYYFVIKNFEKFKKKNELMKVKVGNGELKGVKKVEIKTFSHRGIEVLMYKIRNKIHYKIGNNKFYNENIAKTYINLSIIYKDPQIANLFNLLNKKKKLDINNRRILVKDEELYFSFDGKIYTKIYHNYYEYNRYKNDNKKYTEKKYIDTYEKISEILGNTYIKKLTN